VEKQNSIKMLQKHLLKDFGEQKECEKSTSGVKVTLIKTPILGKETFSILDKN